METIEAVEAVDILTHHHRGEDHSRRRRPKAIRTTRARRADEEDPDNVVIGQRLPVSPEEEEADGESELRRVNEAGGGTLPEQLPAAQPNVQRGAQTLPTFAVGTTHARVTSSRWLARRGEDREIKSKIGGSRTMGVTYDSHMSTIARLREGVTTTAAAAVAAQEDREIN